MSWKEHHRRSATLASEAEQALRGSETAAARELYAQAANAEEKAVADLDVAKQRTLGISVVSAAALHYKAHDFFRSQAVAYAWLAKAVLPEFAVEQLRTLLETIWAEERQNLSGVEFAPERVLVSAQGGDVLRGGARLDLIVPAMERVLKFLRRTAAMVSGEEFRPRGRQTRFVKDNFRPWVLQTPPGSYQFAVALEQQSRGNDMSSERTFQSDVVEQAMAILSTVGASAAQLDETVPDKNYQDCFLRLAYDLAPSGTSHDRLVLRATGVAADLEVTLDVNIRRRLAATLWPEEDVGTNEHLPDERRLVGRLYAVDLKRGWFELTDGSTNYRVSGVSDEFHASVAELLNEAVVANVTRQNAQYSLKRIERQATRGISRRPE